MRNNVGSFPRRPINVDAWCLSGMGIATVHISGEVHKKKTWARQMIDIWDKNFFIETQFLH